MYLLKTDISRYNFQKPSSKWNEDFEDGLWKL